MGTRRESIGGHRPRRGRRSRRLLIERLEVRELLSAGDWMDGGIEPSDWGQADAMPAIVQVRLQATDLCGNPIERVSVGGNFWLEAYVQDLRANAKGVFAAYLDVPYDASLVSARPGYHDLTYATSYPNGQSGMVTTGLLDEVGGFSGFKQLGGDEHLLFAVPFSATATGVVNFAARPADEAGNQFLIYDVDAPVPGESVRFVGKTLTIEAGARQAAHAGGEVAASSLSTRDLTCRGAIVANSGARLASVGVPEPLDPFQGSEPAPDPWSWSPDDGISVEESPADDVPAEGLTPEDATADEPRAVRSLVVGDYIGSSVDLAFSLNHATTDYWLVETPGTLTITSVSLTPSSTSDVIGTASLASTLISIAEPVRMLWNTSTVAASVVVPAAEGTQEVPPAVAADVDKIIPLKMPDEWQRATAVHVQDPQATLPTPRPRPAHAAAQSPPWAARRPDRDPPRTSARRRDTGTTPIRDSCPATRPLAPGDDLLPSLGPDREPAQEPPTAEP